MDADYGQAQLQRPVYDQEPQQGLGSGVEEKPKMPMLKKVKEKMKAPVKKLKHSIAKRSKNHGDKPGDDDTASPDSNAASPDIAVSPDPEEEEEGYEEEEEQQEADQEVHGGDRGLRDAIARARDEDYQTFGKQDEAGKEGLGFGDYQGKLQEDPAAPGSVTGFKDDQQHSLLPTAGGDRGLRHSLAGARDEDYQAFGEQDEAGKEGLGFGDYQEKLQEDPAAPGSVTGFQDDQQHSFHPTAGEEVDANPSLTRSFEHMSVSDQPEKNEKHEQTQQDETLPTSQDVIPTASHDQFSPEPMQEDEQKLPNFASIEHTGSHNQFSREPMQEDEQRPHNSPSTEHGQERGDLASPAGSQKEGTYRELPTQEHNPSESLPNENLNNLSYTTKISAAAAGLASTVYGKATTAGTVLKEKVVPRSSPSGQQQPGQQLSEQTADQVQQQPGYTQKVYAAIQPAKERAAALASTVYEKAAGAGAVAKEKVAGAGATAAGASAAAKDKAAGTGEAAKEKAAGARAQAGQKGAGVKNTIAEKLKPGEEEKALSEVIAEMISSRKETAKEKAYEAGDTGAEKAREQTAVAREKANELKDKTAEAKDVGTEKAKEKATQAREGTNNDGTPVVEKIKGAVTSLFGTRASADTQTEGEQSMQESTEGKQLQHRTNNVGTPAVEKIKGAVTSLFGTRAPADAEVEAAGDQATQESSDGKRLQ